MYRNPLINLVFLFLTLTSEIEGENLPFIYEYFPYPSEFKETDFRPDNLQIGIDGREYMMDTQSKTICVKEGKEIRCGGGFGFEESDFITPVSMAYSNLLLFTLRSEDIFILPVVFHPFYRQLEFYHLMYL